MRYEVSRYSQTWKQWIRYSYATEAQARKQYERWKKHGKKVKPPRPMKNGSRIWRDLIKPGRPASLALALILGLVLIGLLATVLNRT